MTPSSSVISLTDCLNDNSQFTLRAADSTITDSEGVRYTYGNFPRADRDTLTDFELVGTIGSSYSPMTKLVVEVRFNGVVQENFAREEDVETDVEINGNDMTFLADNIQIPHYEGNYVINFKGHDLDD